MKPLIQVQGLHYRPPSLPEEEPDILRGISLSIMAGEFVAIIGENGSGKTTLVKNIAGLLLPTKGHVIFNGSDLQHKENQRLFRAKIGMVFQNPADQIVASTVEEDVAFGLENLNLPTQQIRERVSEQLEEAGLSSEATRPPHLLSGGQIQKLALAGVLARQPQAIIFDEPTSMLDPATRASFLRQLCLLHQQGMTIIYITHHMEEAVYADKIVVLQGGKLKIQGSPAEVFLQEQLLYEIGLDIPEVMSLSNELRNLSWQLPKDILTPSALIQALPDYAGSAQQTAMSSEQPDSSCLISIKDVHYTYLHNTPLAKKALTGASMCVSSHQIHGIAGNNGSGKSTLLQHLNGILRPMQGSVEVGSFKLEDPKTRLKDVIKLVGLVFQNPETQFFEIFVGDEIAYGPKQLKLGNLRERVKEAMALVQLDFERYKDRRLETLSGGEKRKVALASTLVLDQNILLFDEPSAGMDPMARKELLALFTALNQSGKTLLISTHRLDELAVITQELSIMQAGKVVYTGLTKQILADQKSINQAGLVPPLAVKISNALINKGWPIIGKDTTTPQKLVSTLKRLST